MAKKTVAKKKVTKKVAPKKTTKKTETEKASKKVAKTVKKEKKKSLIDFCIEGALKAKGKKVKTETLIERINKAAGGDAKDHVIKSYLLVIGKVITAFGLGEADAKMFNLK